MNESVGNHVRAFGMTGYQITDDLSTIEERYAVQLGHIELPSNDETSKDVRFESTVRREARDMARHYETFYCLEQSIRKLVATTLRDAEGVDWFSSSRVPKHVGAEVQKRKDREVDSGFTQRSEEDIDYTTFGELGQLITSNFDVFGAIFKTSRAVTNVMTQLNLLRGPIAHCCPMTDDEVDRLDLVVRDWFRQMS